MKSIIKIALLSTAFSLTSLANANGAPDASKPVMKKVADGVYEYHQYHYNSLVVVTDEGVMLTDPSQEPRASQMRAAIRKLTDKPVVKVIYTHNHFDHTRGGQIFKDEGAEFITQENCVELLSRDTENKVVQADVTYKDKMSIALGGKQVDLHYYGQSDGHCMSVVHMPKEKVLLAVDWHLPGHLVEPIRLIALDYVGTLNTMKRVRKDLEFDKVINGHAPFDSPKAFDENQKFVQALYDAVLKGINEGKTTQELMKTVKLPQVSHWYGYKENFPGHVERMAYAIWHGN